MATNPRYPEEPERQDKYRDVHPKLQAPPKRRFPWILVAIVAAVALFVAIITQLPHGLPRNENPPAAQVPQQPTGNQVQLSNVSMKSAPVGGAFYLVATLNNNGTTAITGVQVQADFRSQDGRVLKTETRPVQGMVAGPEGTAEDLAKTPIQPNTSRTVRVYFDNYPYEWNKQVPGLTVTAVTATTPSGAGNRS